MNIFITELFSDPVNFALWSLFVIFSICCHEFAHAWVAKLCGDSTAADSGHLTLNPLKQMGVTSLVIFLLIGIAWGQVPVNTANLRGKWAKVAVDLAGVGMNVVLMLVFVLISCAAEKAGSEAAASAFFMGAVLNAVLALLNILPIPPLDGFSALNALFPELVRMSSEFLRGAYLFLILAMFTFGFKYLWRAADYVVEHLTNAVLTVIL